MKIPEAIVAALSVMALSLAPVAPVAAAEPGLWIGGHALGHFGLGAAFAHTVFGLGILPLAIVGAIAAESLEDRGYAPQANYEPPPAYAPRPSYYQSPGYYQSPNYYAAPPAAYYAPRAAYYPPAPRYYAPPASYYGRPGGYYGAGPRYYAPSGYQAARRSGYYHYSR